MWQVPTTKIFKRYFLSSSHLIPRTVKSKHFVHMIYVYFFPLLAPRYETIGRKYFFTQRLELSPLIFSVEKISNLNKNINSFVFAIDFAGPYCMLKGNLQYTICMLNHQSMSNLEVIWKRHLQATRYTHLSSGSGFLFGGQFASGLGVTRHDISRYLSSHEISSQEKTGFLHIVTLIYIQPWLLIGW